MIDKIYIFGLGNMGEKYIHTRHNAGRIVADFIFDNNLIKDTDFVYYPIECYMNESGNYIKKLLKNKKYSNFIIIYDDKDLEFGVIKKSISRGDGGHNGIKNIIDNFGKDFYRLRIGIDNHNIKDTADFVLNNFYKTELQILQSQDFIDKMLIKISEIKKEIISNSQNSQKTQ